MFYDQLFLRYFFPGLVASILFLGIYEIALRIRNERCTWFSRVIFLFMGLYLTMVFALTVSPEYSFSMKWLGQNINVIPFQAMQESARHSMNFRGNIIMFIPFGTLLVLLSKKFQNPFRVLIAGAGLSLFIELLQLFTLRSTDIDDIILNTTGALCGFILGKLILLCVPSLGKLSGVLKKVEDKLYRNHAGAGNVVALSVLIFTAVFITGFSTTHIASPLPGEPELAMSEQPVEVPDSEKVSANIVARNAYLWNISTNKVLYEKESRERIAPASTAKLLTALTALDYCGEEERVSVGKEVCLIAEDASRAWLNPGNELTVRQLLNALLLPSGNDAAYALAVFTGRKICENENITIEVALDTFVREMNRKAAQVGAADSNFIRPDGYDADGQYTTVRDLACIARQFWKSNVLRDIAESHLISDTWLSGQKVTHNNSNQLINPDSPYYYKDAVGLKTGKSVDAGACLVSAAYIDQDLYICVVMGSAEEGRWTDSLALYEAVSLTALHQKRSQ